jgi:hypothetical protein
LFEAGVVIATHALRSWSRINCTRQTDALSVINTKVNVQLTPSSQAEQLMARCAKNSGSASMPEKESSKKPNPSHLRRFYQKHLERWQQSQLSQKEYCRQNEIILHRFTYWKKRLADDNQAGPTFVPVPLAQNFSHSATSKIDLIIAGGFKIQVGPGFDPVTLKQLIHTLGSL